MSRPLTFEDFGFASEPAPETVDLDEHTAAVEAAYARGFEAARAEAAAERSANVQQGEEAVRSHLQELSFTYEEARAHVMTSLSPLLRAIAAQAVPRILHHTLPDRLAETLAELARESTDDRARLWCAPGDRDLIAPFVAHDTMFPVDLAEDEGLAPGRLRLTLGDAGRAIDLTALERRLSEALGALDHTNEEILRHG